MVYQDEYGLLDLPMPKLIGRHQIENAAVAIAGLRHAGRSWGNNERAIETITSSQPKVTTVVLNKVDFARNKYYYSRYYGHQYKNYYAEAAV